MSENNYSSARVTLDTFTRLFGLPPVRHEKAPPVSEYADHPGFLDDILDHPQEDAPRIIYADWLEDNGRQERADFIRVQIDLERLRQKCRCGACVGRLGGGQKHNGPCAIRRDRSDLLDSEKKTLGAFPGTSLAREWFGGPWWEENDYCKASDDTSQPQWLRIVAKRVLPALDLWFEFRRGFVHAIYIESLAFMRLAGDLFRAQPIERVNLQGQAPSAFRGSGPSRRWLCAESWQTQLRADALPRPIFELLERHANDVARRSEQKVYPNQWSADEARSRACVLYGQLKARGA